jgi:hypothetical protein
MTAAREKQELLPGDVDDQGRVLCITQSRNIEEWCVEGLVWVRWSQAWPALRHGWRLARADASIDIRYVMIARGTRTIMVPR